MLSQSDVRGRWPRAYFRPRINSAAAPTGDQIIGHRRVGWELVREPGVEVGELHRLVKAGRAGRREGGILRAVFANSLAADVDVPRQTLRRLAADDLMERIVLILHDRDADLDRPVIVRHVRRDFGLRFPAEPAVLVGAAIEVDQRRRLD